MSFATQCAAEPIPRTSQEQSGKPKQESGSALGMAYRRGLSCIVEVGFPPIRFAQGRDCTIKSVPSQPLSLYL